MHIADDMPAFWLVILTMLYSESFSASGKSFWDDALEYLSNILPIYFSPKLVLTQRKLKNKDISTFKDL